jgi:hypothetical protein
MGRSQRAAICGVSWNNPERTAVVTDRVFSTMVITLVLVCVSLATPAEAQLNTQHIKGTVGLKKRIASASRRLLHRAALLRLQDR